MGTRRVVAVLLASVLSLVAGCALRRHGDVTVTFQADGVAPTTVTAPSSAGKPVVSALPAPSPDQFPVGVRALSRPVHITTPKALGGTATITMTYDPAQAGPGDVAVYLWVPDMGLWLPAGDDVDPAKHTVSAETGHFSDWMLGVTDPDRLRYDKALAERLNGTLGGRVVGLMYGKARALDCDPDGLLVPAAVKSDLIAGPAELCEEADEHDGSYQLEWMNTTELPVVFDLPAGFSETSTDYRANPLIQGVLQRHHHPDGALVSPDRSLTVKFPGSAVAAGARINGEVDWSLYLIALMRQIVSVALYDKSTENPKARDRLDTGFEAADKWDCAGEGANEWQESHDVGKMVRAAVAKCKAQLAQAVGEAMLATGKKALKAIGKFLTSRLNVLLSLGELMEFARAEIAGLLALPGAATGALDTTVTVAPGRVMTYDEAMRLPVATPSPDQPGCPRLPAGSWPPAGMPQTSLCVQSIDADLDGNGHPDRLLTWRPPWGSPGDELDRKRLGAVAYLDDGSFHRLAVPVSRWTDVDGLDAFDLGAVAHLGPDARTQVLIADIIGSSTLHHTVLAVNPAGELRPVTMQGRIADLMSGDAASYGSAWGCVLSRGKPLVVQSGWSRDVTKPNPPVPWSRSFYTYDGTDLTQVGSDGGTARPGGRPATGSNCATADPARRGPEIGPVR